MNRILYSILISTLLLSTNYTFAAKDLIPTTEDLEELNDPYIRAPLPLTSIRPTKPIQTNILVDTVEKQIFKANETLTYIMHPYFAFNYNLVIEDEDLSELCFYGLDLSHFTFKNCDFKKSNLHKTTLGPNLTGNDFDGAEICEATLSIDTSFADAKKLPNSFWKTAMTQNTYEEKIKNHISSPDIIIYEKTEAEYNVQKNKIENLKENYKSYCTQLIQDDSYRYAAEYISYAKIFYTKANIISKHAETLKTKYSSKFFKIFRKTQREKIELYLEKATYYNTNIKTQHDAIMIKYGSINNDPIDEKDNS